MKGVWLALLTIREAILKGTLIFYFAVGNIIIIFFAFALTVSPDDGKTLLLLGNPVTPRGIEGFKPVEFLILQLFQSSISSLILFGVFATAGLIPAMLEKGTVELYLSKPLSRSSLLLFRSAGACGGIMVNILYFAAGIFAVFGFKTGVWHSALFPAALMASVAFFFYYSIVAFSTVVLRSTGFTIMLAFVYSLFSGALALREKVLYPWWDNIVYHRFLDAVYYATPQMDEMLTNSARILGTNPFILQGIGSASQTFDVMPFVCSLLSASLIYGGAVWYFSSQDF